MELGNNKRNSRKRTLKVSLIFIIFIILFVGEVSPSNDRVHFVLGLIKIRITDFILLILCAIWWISTALAAFLILWNGVRYITSEDLNLREKARSKIIQAIIGLIFILISCPLVNFLISGTQIEEFKCECLEGISNKTSDITTTTIEIPILGHNQICHAPTCYCGSLYFTIPEDYRCCKTDGSWTMVEKTNDCPEVTTTPTTTLTSTTTPTISTSPSLTTTTTTTLTSTLTTTPVLPTITTTTTPTLPSFTTTSLTTTTTFTSTTTTSTISTTTTTTTLPHQTTTTTTSFTSTTTTSTISTTTTTTTSTTTTTTLPVGICITLLSNGPPSEKLDIVFIGDGYSDSEMDLFVSKVNEHMNALLSVEPYKSYKSKINVHYVRKFEDLECYISGRLIFCNTPNVINLASECPNDNIIVLFKSDEWAGAGGESMSASSYCIASTAYPWLTIHECGGHHIGQLMDEYSYGTTGSLYFSGANCDTSSSCTKWYGLPGTGCYKDCSYTNLYRATEDDCLMRTALVWHFCPVCKRQIKKVLSNYS